MTSGEKKFVGWLAVIAVIVIVVVVVIANNNKKSQTQTQSQGASQTTSTTGEFTQMTKDGTKLNTSSVLNQDKQYNGFTFTNIQLTEKNNQTTLLADVKNTSGADVTKFTSVDVVFYAKDGSKIATIPGLISPLANGESTQFNAGGTFDYSNAYDLKIVAHGSEN